MDCEGSRQRLEYVERTAAELMDVVEEKENMFGGMDP